MEKARVIIIGTGRSADSYVSFAIRHPELLCISGIASADRERRDFLAGKCSVPRHCRFDSWTDILERPCFADGAVIADPGETGDASLASLERGYHLRLEHPEAVGEKHCLEIVGSSGRKGLCISSSNPFLLVPSIREVLLRLSRGEFGDARSASHETHISPRTLSLLARSSQGAGDPAAPLCHEYDLLCRVMRGRPSSISLFEGESAIAPENAPRGAAPFCRGCPAGERCRFNADRLHGKSSLRLFSFLKKKDAFSETALELYPHTGGKGNALQRCIFTDGSRQRDLTARLMFQDSRTASLTRIAVQEQDQRAFRIQGTLASAVASCSVSLVVRRESGSPDFFAFPDSPAERRKHTDGEIRRFADSLMGTIPLCSAQEALQGCLLSHAAFRSLKNGAPSSL